MIEIAVASENPTKLSAVELAASEFWVRGYRTRGFKTESGVSDQPMNDEEMIEGAINRARNVVSQYPVANYAVGLEGGMRVLPEGWFNLGWVCALDVASGEIGVGATLAHAVPRPVVELMQQKEIELSDAVAKIYHTNTVADRDCSGVITGGLLPADRIYAGGVLSALTDLNNKLRNSY